MNALAALQARISGDDAAWRGSGVAGFMDELSTFLATERHRAKFIGPAREVSREIRLLHRAVPGQQALIEQTEAELRKRYDEAQAPLRRLQTRAQQMRQELDLAQKHVLAVVRAEVASRLVRMSSEAPEIIAALTPDATLSLRPWRAKDAAGEYARELAQLASAEALSRFKAWQKQDLKAIVDPDLDAMARRADELFREFMRDLAKIREGLTGLDPAAGDGLPGLGGDQSLDGGELAGLDFAGGQALRHLIGRVAALYGVALVWWFLTPFGFIPLIVGVLMANNALGHRAAEKMEQKVRTELSAAFAKKMRDDAPQSAEQIAAAFQKVLSSAIGELMTRVDSELRQLRVQVEDALGALNKGEDEVKRRRDLLAEWDQSLEMSADAVEDLIADVMRA